MTRMAFYKFNLLLLCFFYSLTFAEANDWRQFRGNLCDGIASDAKLPQEWDAEKNIAWKTPLEGRGLSGPIVVNNRVYLTSSEGFSQNRLNVLCFNIDTGAEIWKRSFQATGRTVCHQKMCVATPTPCSDGERIFAFYSSNDVACLDLDGNLLWYRGLTFDYPNASNSLGMSSSPVVVGKAAIFQVESDADSFAFGLDVETGETLWKVDRPRKANWTSPILYPASSSQAPKFALLQSSAGLDAVVPATGKTVWSYADGASTIPSSVVSGETIYIPSNGLTAITPHESSSSPELVWQVENMEPGTPSPIVTEGKVFTINRSGVLACGDIEKGKRIWQLRLKGRFSSSPIVASGLIYAFNEEGTGFVVDPSGKKGKIVSRNDLGETILCTPAVSDNALFVRSDDNLWKIAN